MDHNQRILILFIATILVTLVLNVAAMTRAARFYARAVAVRTAPRLDLQSAPPGATLAPVTPVGLVVHRLQSPIPLDDPHDKAWGDASALRLALVPQIVAMPILEKVTIGQVQVKAVTDGQRIAWRLSWTDPSADSNVDAARFCDAAAIQFPLDTGAPHTMGANGFRVQILHWKALWQKDVDEHFQDVQDLYPNTWSDLYWFAEGSHPYPVPQAFASEVSQQWLIGYRAGNPLSDFHRSQPVEELVAEGFGTLTHQTQSASTGRGVWKDGQWAVVFSRPLVTDDPLDYRFGESGKGVFSVAIWDGAAGNVGGRKHWSTWIPFEVQP